MSVDQRVDLQERPGPGQGFLGNGGGAGDQKSDQNQSQPGMQKFRFHNLLHGLGARGRTIPPAGHGSKSARRRSGMMGA